MTLPCSAASLAVGEDLAATAPTARAWLVIEQPGPWGRQALLDSHIDRALGARIAELASGAGLTVLLARHPGRPERAWDPADRRAWIAVSAPGGMRLREGVLPDPSVVADWDFASLAGGHLPPFGQRTDEPLLLVCTHSGRDACCAIHGRALVDAIGPRPRVWECSHLGGHRFAATALSLPGGYVYGRLDSVGAQAIITSAEESRMRLAPARGRSCFPAPLQSADLAVREAIGETSLAALDVLRVVGDRVVPMQATARADEDVVECEARHTDGRAWRVTVTRDATGGVRIESCLGEPHPVLAWRVTALAESSAWRTP